MSAEELFAGVFPIASELAHLELVEPCGAENGAVALTIRLVVFDRNDEQELCIRDVKEQSVYMLSAAQREDPRLKECIAGWAEAVAQALADERLLASIDELMPCDLCVVGPMLTRKRPQVAGDFAYLALTTRKLLGKFVKE